MPVYEIWIEGRVAGTRCNDLAISLALLHEAVERWKRDHCGGVGPMVRAVRSADGALFLSPPLLLRRAGGKPLTKRDWTRVRTLLPTAAKTALQRLGQRRAEEEAA